MMHSSFLPAGAAVDVAAAATCLQGQQDVQLREEPVSRQQRG